MQVAACTLHDDLFQRADHTKVSPLYEENFRACDSSNNNLDRPKTGPYGMSIIHCYNSKQKKMSVTKLTVFKLQGGSNMTGTDLCVNKPHCAAAVRP